MLFYTRDELEKLVREDVPYLDLTTFLLEIGSQKGEISYSFRHDAVVCGTEEAVEIFKLFNIEVVHFVPSGTFVKSKEPFLKGKGSAENLHIVWKAVQTLIEYASGIATRTFKLVSLAIQGNPKVAVVTTRKHFPGTKKLSIKAILAGGALPHRLGLSETILVFQEHLNFLGGYQEFFKVLPSIKTKVPEKKIVLEVKDLETALLALKHPVDVLQLDKFPIPQIKTVVEEAKKLKNPVKIAAAGGINENNIKEVAETGVDIIVLSSAYFGKPADVKVNLKPI